MQRQDITSSLARAAASDTPSFNISIPNICKSAKQKANIIVAFAMVL